MEGIAKLLPPAIRQQLFRSESSLLELLNSLWSRMVGRAIAHECRPVDFRAGTLTIATSCPTWAVQFRQLGEDIRSNINRFLGADLVRKMRVRLDPTFIAPALPDTAESARPEDPFRVPSSGTSHGDGGVIDDVLRHSCEKYFSRPNRKSD